MPILGHHELGRLHELCGLMLDDIDFEKPAIIFQDNAIRTLKSEAAHRREPLVPEVLRLGSLDYCRAMRDAGHTVVFPCLRARGERTPMSNLFYKKYKKLLDGVLPLAGEQRKSFHSERKSGNTAMINANCNDALRHAVMGHAHTGTNEKHYLDEVHDAAKLLALSAIPIVTAHLQPYAVTSPRGRQRA